MLKIGVKAPDFTLKDKDGNEVTQAGRLQRKEDRSVFLP